MTKIFRGNAEIIFEGWEPDPKFDFINLFAEKWKGGYLSCSNGPACKDHNTGHEQFYLNSKFIAQSFLNEIKERQYFDIIGKTLSKEQFNNFLKSKGINYAYK